MSCCLLLVVQVTDVPQLVGIREHYAQQGYRCGSACSALHHTYDSRACAGNTLMSQAGDDMAPFGGVGVTIKQQLASYPRATRAWVLLQKLCSVPLPISSAPGVSITPFRTRCCCCWCCCWRRTPCLFGWSDMQRLLAQALPDSVPINLGMQFDQ